MKVVPQAGNCAEVEVGGRIYRRGRDGLFDMPEAAAKYTIRHEGGQMVTNPVRNRRSAGYICRPCNFGSFFKVCGRCGGECEREVA